MAWQYCMVSAVVVVVLLLMGTGGSADIDSMVCYKPPPPTNKSADHHELFLFDVDLEIPPYTPITIVKKSSSITINDTCGVRFFTSYTVNNNVLQHSYLVCKYFNESTPKQTPLPVVDFRVTQAVWRTQYEVSVTFVFNYIVESDGELKLHCKVEFPPGEGGILVDSFINCLISFKLRGCPHARHGVHCDKPCLCAAGIECHPFTGECVCPRGLQGESCNRARPMLLLEGPLTLFVRYGEAAALICTAYGMAPSQWWWDRSSVTLETRNGTEDVLYYPRPFHVSTIVTATSAEVNGVYTCNVVNINQLYSRNVTVIVAGIPNPFLEAPSNQSIILGSRAELRCRTKPEAGTLTWMKGNQTISQAWLDGKSDQTIGRSLMVAERNQTISIIIAHVRFEDAGRYQCIVGHEGANDSAVTDAWLTVESQGSWPNITTGSPLRGANLTVQEFDRLTAVCSVHEAYPEPSISWFTGEEDRTKDATVKSRTSLNGVSYDVDSTLTFHPTWHDDRKRMKCVSSVPNIQLNRSRDVLLSVSYAPKVIVAPREKSVQPGDSPLFTCSAPANPSVSGYNWTLRRKNGMIVKKYTGRSVRVNDVDTGHNMASLTCYVMNNVGSNSSKAVIKVFDAGDDEHSEIHWALMIAALSILAVLMVVMPILVYKHRGKIQDLFFRNQRNQILKGKQHDVFVAYKGGRDEEEFVIHRLVPKLEEWGCDVCIHYQNFLPGREITDNITAAVSSCRKTILVLSPDFMASEWCYFEFLCAVDEMLRNQTNFIIPLMFKDIQIEGLCQSMQNMLDTVSFIPWPAEGAACTAGPGQTDEFWKLLKRAVETEFNVNRHEDMEGDEGDENVQDEVAYDEHFNLITL